MTKVVINVCFGGFSLSDKANARLAKLGSPYVRKWTDDEREQLVFKEDYCLYNIPRHDPLLVQVVEELGKAAWGAHAELKVVKIPGKLYRIDEYDGREQIETPDTLDWIDVTAPTLAVPAD